MARYKKRYNRKSSKRRKKKGNRRIKTYKVSRGGVRL